ncbi:hypothetical protein KSP40_PGU000167 [Platanthera guangdongensis]|uniref:Uncharacterized protein n=1 Tax=Platanthera guangdongensis TaxID=2320717 RepID=A0ABR2LNJ6_9ASPA
MSQCPLDTPIGEIHEAAFRSTFGPENYDRCRIMGSGVTAIQVYPDLSRRSNMSGNTNSREMREIDQLKLQVTNMQKTIDCLVNAISHQGSREDCSGTSMGPGVYLSTDQLAKMMNTIYRSNQNTESNPEDTPPTEPNTRVHPEHGFG